MVYLIYYYTKRIDKKIKHFLWYLFFTFLLGIISEILFIYGQKNLYVYNTLTLLEFNVLFLLYNKISQEKITKAAIKYGSIVFNIIYICSTFYYLSTSLFLEKYNIISTASGSILVSVVLFLFLREFLISNKIVNYTKTLSFWITFGLFIYYLGTTPAVSLLNFLSKESNIIEDFTNIQFYLSVFMHSCFIFGVLWSQNKVK